MNLNNKKYILFLILIYFASASMYSTNYIFNYISAYLEHIGYNRFVIGIVQSIPRFIAGIALFLFWNRIEKVNKLFFLTLSAFLGIICFLGFALFNNIYIIVFLCIIFSLFVFSIRVFFVPFLIENIISPEKRRESILWFSSANTLGSILGPGLADFFGSFLLFSGANLLGGFFYSFIALILLIFVSLILRSEKSIESTEKINSSSQEKISFSNYFLIMPVAVLAGMFFFSEMGFVPVYVEGMEKPSIFFMSFGVVAFLIRIFFAPKIKKFKITYILVYSIILCSFSCMFLFLFHYYSTWWVLLLAGISMGLGHGIFFPITNALFVDITPNNIISANACFSFIYLISGTITLPILGIIADYFGYQMVFITLVFVSIFFIFYIKLYTPIVSLIKNLDKSAS